ncbi:hypothetical protein [Pseudomonas sp. GL-B-19]|uniref:hypothetical protein n=1 Tax=Pseudomonas sp. GL-B-19 TaxID=2832393 RepID=UPI001CBD3E67|nr:hypothetical protein [Pseudomonas sp. GL-B-19]
MNRSRSSQVQKDLANILGIEITNDTFDVAAARLLDHVAAAIGHEPAEPSSDRQRAYAASLCCDVTNETKRVASAKIGEALSSRNQEAISTLDLKPGDQVVRLTQFEYDGELRSFEQAFVVSSIQPNGRVFFKGGNGQGAWPTQLRKLTELHRNSKGVRQSTQGQ